LFLSKGSWFIEPLEFWIFESIDWISFFHSSPWLWEDRSVIGCETMDFFINSLITNVLLVLLGKSCWFVKPLESWVLESVLWVSFFDSSPWLWENRSVIGCETVDFLINSLVTNVLLGMVMLVMMFVLVLVFKLGIVSVAVVADGWWWTTNWGNTLHWNFTVETIESVAWLLFSLCKGSWFIKPLESWVFEPILWVSFFDSSPWLWENRSVIGGKSMNFLIDSLVADIFLFLLSKSSWFIEPLEFWVFESILWVSFFDSSPWLWKN